MGEQMEESSTFWKALPIWLVGIAVLTAVCGTIFRITAVTFVDNYKLAYTFNRLDGKIERVSRTGYLVNWPVVVDVHTIDLRPMQVCISSYKRVLNCKLVEFDPKGLSTFLEWHGRNDYEQDSHDSDGSLNALLKIYAYDESGKSYPFLKVLRELKNDGEQK